MMDRRQFMDTAGSAAACFAMLPVIPAHTSGKLPPPSAIARLSSMRELASPISTGEYQQRMERARQLLSEGHMQALMLCGGNSLAYFCGLRWTFSERLLSLLLPAKGTPLLICPQMQFARVRELLPPGLLAGFEVRAWEEDEDPYRLTAAALADRSIRTGTIGVEETVPYGLVEALSGAAPGLSLVSGQRS